jgi:hypothetical protein
MRGRVVAEYMSQLPENKVLNKLCGFWNSNKKVIQSTQHKISLILYFILRKLCQFSYVIWVMLKFYLTFFTRSDHIVKDFNFVICEININQSFLNCVPWFSVVTDFSMDVAGQHLAL